MKFIDVAYPMIIGVVVMVSMLNSYQRGRLAKGEEVEARGPVIGLDLFRQVEAQRDDVLAMLKRTTEKLEKTTESLRQANERDR